jgi:hypothetical protein
MIFCKPQGRLGNILFNIATGLSLATKLNTELIVNTVSWAGHRGYVPVDLSIFEYPFKQEKESKDIKYIHTETHLHYKEIEIQEEMILSGVFASWKYFDDIKEELITKYFTPNLYIKSKVDNYKIGEKSLGISIRRGDFLALQHNHCVLDLEYYQTAIDTYFKEKIDSVYIFSDDIEWCKKVFGNEVCYVEEDIGVQLFLMTKMKHLILSNSTFAWWGGYLNTQGGYVVAPIPWLGPSYDHLNTEDLYYPTWIKHQHSRKLQEISPLDIIKFNEESSNRHISPS